MLQIETIPKVDTAVSLPSCPGAPGPSVANVADLPGLEMQYHWITDPDLLAPWIPQWHRLVVMAAEPNVFYEPEFLLPALRHLRGNDQVGVMLITAPPRVNPEARPVICGLVPIRMLNRFSGLPVRVAEFWRHDHCFLTTPLIRRDVLSETWANFSREGLTSIGGKKTDWISLPMTAGEGPVHSMLVDWMEQNRIHSHVRRRYRRAILIRESGFDAFMSRRVPKKSRQESTRLGRKLQRDLGFAVDATGGSKGVKDLLDLEMSGWKGHEGTALASCKSTLEFFAEMTTSMSLAGKLHLLSLQIDGKAAASKLNLLTGSHGFAFKIAFDEQMARYSPGMLLEVENIRHLHESTSLQTMDSCADPNHPMINHLWPERRGIESLLVSCGTRRGNWLMAARPLLQQLSKSFRRRTANTS